MSPENNQKWYGNTNTIPLQLQSKQTFRTGCSAVSRIRGHVRHRARPGAAHTTHIACVAPPPADVSAVREIKGAHTHATCNATSSAQNVQPARHCSHVFTSRLPDPSHAATLIVDSLRTNRTMTQQGSPLRQLMHRPLLQWLARHGRLEREASCLSFGPRLSDYESAMCL